jgi:hypothetical protein
MSETLKVSYANNEASIGATKSRRFYTGVDRDEAGGQVDSLKYVLRWAWRRYKNDKKLECPWDLGEAGDDEE